MGKYMRKCKGVGELAVMEVSQVVGVRTRARTLALEAAATTAAGSSSNRRKAAVLGEFQISYLQLRSGSLVMKSPRISRSPSNSSGGRLPSPERGRISRCSSNASCEVTEEESRLQFCDSEGGDGLETAVCDLDCSRPRREITPSSARRDESGELESVTERKLTTTASEAEIEEFFAAAERKEKLRFADRYNYDVDNDVPLDGRYEWVRLNP